MKIAETLKTTHDIIAIHFKGVDGKPCEKWVDIAKDGKGDLIAVSIGDTEITALDLAVLAFLRKEGKL